MTPSPNTSEYSTPASSGRMTCSAASHAQVQNGLTPADNPKLEDMKCSTAFSTALVRDPTSWQSDSLLGMLQ